MIPIIVTDIDQTDLHRFEPSSRTLICGMSTPTNKLATDFGDDKPTSRYQLQ